MLWHRYGETLLNIIPESISEVCTAENKPKLYSLVSQALSGMPFDSKSDLPIILSLVQPNAQIRKNALGQIQNASAFKPSLVQLIQHEKDFEVLLTALKLDLDSGFSEVLIKKYQEIITFEHPPTEILQELFRKIMQISETFTIFHVKVILMAYDNPSLRELCPEALKKAKNFELFKDYKGQDLSLYLQQRLVKYWNEGFESILDLIDCPLIYSLLPSTLEKIHHKAENAKSLIIACESLTKSLIEKETSDLRIFTAMVRALPVLELTQNGLAPKIDRILRDLLLHLIPTAPELCKEILAKNYSHKVIQVLCEISQNSPESLHLATCIAFHSEEIEAFLYVFPFLLVNLARDSKFRNSSVVSIEQYIHKSLPNIEIEFHTNFTADLTQFNDKIKLVRKFLRKVMKFKTEILSDSNFIKFALNKCAVSELEPFFAASLNGISYEKNKYIEIFENVKSDGLTNFFIELFENCEQQKEVIKRLGYYQHWKNFPNEQFLVNSIKNEETLKQILNVLNVERVSSFPGLHLEIFNALLMHLPKFSEIIHEKIESFQFPVDVFIKALRFGHGLTQYEAILQIIMYSPQSPKILEALFDELSEKMIEHENNGYLIELILLAIRIQGSGLEISNENLEKIMKTITPESNIETKKNAVLALCSFSDSTKEKIIILLENAIKSIKSPEEYQFYKSVLPKLSNFNISVLVSALLHCAIQQQLGLIEGIIIIKIAGVKYLNIFFNCFIVYDFSELLKSVLIFNASEILQAFNKIISLNPRILQFLEFSFLQNDFIQSFPKSRKVIAEKLAEFFEQLFILISQNSKNSGKGAKSEKKLLNGVLNALNQSLDDPILSTTFSILLLQSSNFSYQKEALEFLLPHIEKASSTYYSLITPLCNILENNIANVSRLHSSKFQNLSVFLQLILSALYILLKNYKDPSKILVVYGNCLLGYTQSSKIEVKSAASLCFSTFFNEKSIDYLPFLETYIEQILDLCENTEEIINNCGIACLKNLIINTEEFINPYTLDIISTACKIRNKDLNKVIAVHIPHRTLIEKLSESLNLLKKNKESLENLLEISKVLGEKASNNDVTHLISLIFDFFSNAFKVISTEKKSKNIDKLSLLLGQSFSFFALNFTNSQLKPGFLEIFQWCLEKNEEETYDYSRMLCFTNLVLNLTLSLQNLFIPYFSHFFEVFIDILTHFYQDFSSSKHKKSKNKIRKILNNQILLVINHLSTKDTERFLTNDKYDHISEVLSNQFKCIHTDSYSLFCEKHLIPTVISILSSTADQSVWQSFTYKILLQSRSSVKEIRFYSLSCVSKCLSKIGKDYAGLIGDIMPFVLEGIEDTEDTVTEIAKTLMAQLESFCGEEIKNYIG